MITCNLKRFKVGEDCPVFLHFVKLVLALLLLAGGLRHCKKYEAFGLLNVNDIVLAILQLLKDHDLVVHVDIDIHLSDDIFYSTDRVFMTVYSYFWRLFMGTGHQDDIGVGIDKYYSLNVPLEDGIDDESYQYLLQHLNPKQDLSLSIKGHAECVGYEIFQRSPTVVGWSIYIDGKFQILHVDEDLNEGNDRWDTDDMDSILSTVVFGWIFILLGDEALSGC
ncbi:hypothetical protein CICLE_v10003113mg [Citrus x clementina]|uniref:Histone deacetylase domain-containing protein n=1 Tax=Citrus clementina TaxID=85681 RepID=V4TB44_CITCL|nr:hypothetical protein CICLE_v10003113mg [Citrus x clementina]